MFVTVSLAAYIEHEFIEYCAWLFGDESMVSPSHIPIHMFKSAASHIEYFATDIIARCNLINEYY